MFLLASYFFKCICKAGDFCFYAENKSSNFSFFLFRHRQMLEKLFDMDLVMKVCGNVASDLA